MTLRGLFFTILLANALDMWQQAARCVLRGRPWRRHAFGTAAFSAAPTIQHRFWRAAPWRRYTFLTYRSSSTQVDWTVAPDDDDLGTAEAQIDVDATVQALPEMPLDQCDVGHAPTDCGDTLFTVTAPYEPTGDQPTAIAELTRQLVDQEVRFALLQGITGSGKSLVMSHVIAHRGRPTLVLCHNKTLAAQLCRELRSFLKHNAVELFVSYYDHYVPESYNVKTGKYLAKKSKVNKDIDVLRHRATRALMTRRDVVIVASVSCIFGLGMPKDYLDASIQVQVGQSVGQWQDLVTQLDEMLYTESNSDDCFERGQYQLLVGSDGGLQQRGVTIWPPQEDYPLHITFVPDGNSPSWRVESINEGRRSGQVKVASVRLFPAKHHVTSIDRVGEACDAIEVELASRTKELISQGKLEEAERLQKRVWKDVDMMREVGFCPGGENYSRHLTGRQRGEMPDTLMDYLGLHGDWLLMVDESHVTLPQIGAMYYGDRNRKVNLVSHGYRLPSALDHRPLTDAEFWSQVNQTMFVSATPSPRELALIDGDPVCMEIRPTHVLDPDIEVRARKGQLDDLQAEVKARASNGERTLAMTLTKRDSEDLSAFLTQHGIKSSYIHSGMKTHERSKVLKELQSGEIDCLVGINCLREGLDLPQVSLVAILNADSEGFLRSTTALLQIIGRAARNTNGKAILYADRTTKSMRATMDITSHRRSKQIAFNEAAGVEMKSTIGSTTLSIFDLLKNEIDDEAPIQIVGKRAVASDPAALDYALESSFTRIPVVNALDAASNIATDHVPSSPGVYTWSDEEGKILYIGKANNLRSRVRSYLAGGAKHSPRIKVMLQKAASIDFVLTPSSRDALILESNAIKLHQPPYNVLMKDDEHYPYLCASVGEEIPRFTIAPRKNDDEQGKSKYRYFGPYTNFREINSILEGIEEKYDLRQGAFLVRHGSKTVLEYNELFKRVLKEVFSATRSEDSLQAERLKYEEANLLFDSEYNHCRDVVALGQADGNPSEALVCVLQLRAGVVAGRFSYNVHVPVGISNNEDIAAVLQTVLEQRHYPSGQEAADQRFTWFPDHVLLPTTAADATQLRNVIKEARDLVEPGMRRKMPVIQKAVSKGARKEVDVRALSFANENAHHVAYEHALSSGGRSIKTSVDGTAARELATMLHLENAPRRIECYDVSHTQGDFPVASRVVFVDGQPRPDLYRRFNIRYNQGNNDYASLAETLERRCRHLNEETDVVNDDGPWAAPDLIVIDGGVGQLGAAITGMSAANVVPANLADGPGRTLVEETVAIPICALAKEQEQVFVPNHAGPVNAAADSPGLLLLRAIRDESHRFALSSHRSRRSVIKAA